MNYLTRADEILLLTILRLKDNAYGVTIVREVKERAGKRLTLGGLWVSLDSLAKRGYITKRIADPTPERGGRGKIYYLVTDEGIEALHNVSELQQALWEGLSHLGLSKS